MAIKELRIVEVRCDRCELLIYDSVVPEGRDPKEVKKEGSSEREVEDTGPFVLKQDDGTIIISYDVVCDRCRAVLDNLIKKMGKVNRGTRNRPKKKKAESQADSKKQKKAVSVKDKKKKK